MDEVERVIHALLDAVSDREKDESVRNQVETSLVQIGGKKYESSIPAILTFQKERSPSRQQKLMIVNCLGIILESDTVLNSVSENLAQQIIQLAVDSQYDRETLELGSDLLVTMSRRFCIDVMRQMLNLFQPGQLPAASTFRTFGRIFSANVYDSIPFLSAILSMLVPLLPEARTDTLKRAVAGAVSQFAEAIVEYVSNQNEAPDPGVKISFYQNDFGAIFEHFLIHWIPKVKDNETAAYLLHATSCLARVVSPEKLAEQSERLLSNAITIVRRSSTEPNANEGLALALENIANRSKLTLENQLDVVMDVVFSQICSPDYDKPYGLKSHNELLRCFAIMYLNYPDRTITFLLNKMAVNPIKSTVNRDATDRNVVGALSVINKLVNQADVSFSFYLVPLLKNLEPIVSPNPQINLSNNVKQSVAHLVLTLADRLYLVQDNSAPLIEFVVRQCALPPSLIPRSPSGLEAVTDEALRASCENVLHLLTTTVHGMEKVLLPNLWIYLLKPEYTEAVRILARCLIHLHSKQDVFESLRTADGKVTLSYVELFTRLFVLAGFIEELTDEEAVMKLLKLTAAKLSEVLRELWEGTVAEMEKVIHRSMEAGASWDSKSWEEALLKLLETSLKDLKNVEPDTVHSVANSFANQVVLYTERPNEKAFLFISLGISLELSTDPLLVNRCLDSIFFAVNHSRISERQACAAAYGRASSVHFDLILSKLDAHSTPVSPAKKASLFNIFTTREKTPDNEERAKPTIVLCYGQAVSGCPRALLVTRLDDVLRSVLPQFVGVKDFAVKHALCRFTELLAKTLKETGAQLGKRDTLMFHMKDFIKSESAELRSSVRALAISASQELVLLQPKIAMAELEDALMLFCNSFFPLVPPRHDPQADSASLGAGSSVYMNYEIFWDATFNALKDFMISVLKVYRNSESLSVLLKHLRPWMESDSDHERYHALLMLHEVTQSDIANEAVVGPVAGGLSGMIITRAVDPDSRCRETALAVGERIERILVKDAVKEQERWPLLAKSCYLRECLVSPSYLDEVAALFCRSLAGEQITKLTRHLIQQGLLEKRSATATATASVLAAILKTRWNDLQQHCQELINGLLFTVKSVKDVQLKAAVERCLEVVAQFETLTVTETLLQQPIPISPSVSELWRSLGSNPDLASVILVHCIEVLQSTPIYSESSGYVRHISLPVLQSLSALFELLQVSGATGLLQANFSDFLPIMIIVAASCVGAKPPRVHSQTNGATNEGSGDGGEWKSLYKVNPSNLAIACLRELLKHTNYTAPMSFEMISDISVYAEGIYVTMKCICQSDGLDYTRVIQGFAKYMQSDIEFQRAAATASYAAMLESKRPTEKDLIREVVSSLTAKASDDALRVRVFCIRGVGSLANFGQQTVMDNAESIFKVILSGLEDSLEADPFNSAPMEAMRALSRHLSVMDKTLLREHLFSFVLRLRPFFENDNASVRAQAFTLLAQMSLLVDGNELKTAFTQELYGMFVVLLLHLHDDSQDVSAAVRTVFKNNLPLFGSEALNNAFSYPEGFAYSRLLRLICVGLNTDMADKVEGFVNQTVGYLKSESATMRANAVLLLGNLLAQPVIEHGRTSSAQLSPAILQLLNDKESVVRQRTAEALALIYH